jgi:hypothetical protein
MGILIFKVYNNKVELNIKNNQIIIIKITTTIFMKKLIFKN